MMMISLVALGLEPKLRELVGLLETALRQVLRDGAEECSTTRATHRRAIFAEHLVRNLWIIKESRIGLWKPGQGGGSHDSERRPRGGGGC